MAWGLTPSRFSRTLVDLLTHLLDTAPDLYGKPIEIAFLGRLRAELRFDSPKALVEQIHRDIGRAQAFFAARGRA